MQTYGLSDDPDVVRRETQSYVDILKKKQGARSLSTSSRGSQSSLHSIGSYDSGSIAWDGRGAV